MQPPRRRIRLSTTIEVYYGFGDASAVGFILDMEVKGKLLYMAMDIGMMRQLEPCQTIESSRIWWIGWRRWCVPEGSRMPDA
jgi:hypothetical protein